MDLDQDELVNLIEFLKDGKFHIEKVIKFLEALKENSLKN
jgi:hypothetical protein